MSPVTCPLSPATVLGIETSCDETAAAVVRGDGVILSNVIFSQIQEHAPYGGVVPEIAARAHIRHVQHVVEEALAQAGMQLAGLDAIAATAGPGLIGGVIVGLTFGKALAAAADKPFIAVNHLEGHALTARLTDKVEFPYLLLLASGGHCQFVAVHGVGEYETLGETLDDAAGEAFDKAAKLLGLGYPGGPQVEQRALHGNPHAHVFPIPLQGRPGCDLSFSGLKTALRQKVQEAGALSEQQVADFCTAFQYAVGEALAERMAQAVRIFQQRCPQATACVLAGGVAANGYLRTRLGAVAMAAGMTLVCPPPGLCTDNAAMIAWAGVERFRLGKVDALDAEPRARWPLASQV